MALKILWTPKADEGLEKVINYLEEEWTILEILKLENNLKDLLVKISVYPKICPKTSKHNNLHKGFVDKNNYIIYRVDLQNQLIIIINFRGTKQISIY
ncbi:type II toxin-antitoxin system RelE/ParE family toxin [Polaribacter sp. Asnod6-C07]|uniref:type II toxin-antitoxin system RelE/ParE family toxin n=1 Tax=Polaribacter sp. Asnod6-C07 TaxID=3160582 RepID=UPI00386F4FF8